MSNKLLIISGPTATGKTELAVKLANEFNGELISADSRQFYRGMDIGTGKDHPPNIKLNLIDIINPNEIFSVAEYSRLALKEISRIQSEKKLPIIVGGSGLYIDSIINPRPTYVVKPNNFLRYFLNKLSIVRLQNVYKILDKTNFEYLNNSEKNNPHRLIRKIEIKLSSVKLNNTASHQFDFIHICLTAPNKYLFEKINLRVKSRLDQGLRQEISNLLKTYTWSDPGLKTIAYKEFNQPNSISQWTTDEHHLVRRQKTWFKKQPNIHFVDISKPNFDRKIRNLIDKWYN